MSFHFPNSVRTFRILTQNERFGLQRVGDSDVKLEPVDHLTSRYTERVALRVIKEANAVFTSQFHLAD